VVINPNKFQFLTMANEKPIIHNLWNTFRRWRHFNPICGEISKHKRVFVPPLPMPLTRNFPCNVWQRLNNKWVIYCTIWIGIVVQEQQNLACSQICNRNQRKLHSTHFYNVLKQRWKTVFHTNNSDFPSIFLQFPRLNKVKNCSEQS
jgi:hypothetical protein